MNLIDNKGIKFRNTIAGRLIISIAVIFFFIYSLSMIFIYYQRKDDIIKDARNELNNVADIKKHELVNWMDERFSDLRFFSEGRTIGKALRSRYYNRPVDKDYTDYIIHQINNIKKIYKTFEEIFITDPSGIIIYSTNTEYIGSRPPGFINPDTAIAGEIEAYKVYRSRGNKAILTLATKIRDKEPNKDIVIGSFVLLINIEEIINPILQEREGMGKTGEVLLVNRDSISLIELRWKKNSALNFKNTALPAMTASQGKEGIVEAEDYRGVPVIAATRYVPSMNWGMVVKVDRAELFEPLHELFIQLIIIFFSGIILFLAVIYKLTRWLMSPIKELDSAAEKIAAGDFSIVIDESRRDELGRLASSFNNMNRRLASLFRDRDGMQKISGILSSTIDFDELLKASLREIAPFLNCQSAMFYYFNSESGMLEWAAGHAPSRPGFEKIQPGVGYIGETAKSKKIMILRDIPESAEYTIIAGDREMKARTSIHAPLIFHETLIGVLVLNSIHDIDEHASELLEMISQQFAVALNNSIVYEKVLDQTENLNAANEELTATNEEMEAANEEMEAANEELQATNEEMDRQAAELHDKAMELIEQQEKVKEADRLKSEFLSNMSHELRTPLNSIMAISQGLVHKLSQSPDKTDLEYVKIIERNGEKLLRLINDILDLAKIEAGKTEINLSTLKMENLIKAALSSIYPLAGEKGLEVKYVIEENFPEFQGDADKLTQVIINIAGNAVKFTEKGGITIEAGTRNGMAGITIADTGIGIREEDIPHIFEEFRQLDGSVNRKYGGTGLGLSIVKKLMSLMGGSISVESRFGAGTSFTVNFPLNRKPLNEGVDKSVEKKGEERIGGSRTILIIEDNPDNRSSLKFLLHDYKLEFIDAPTGKEGCEYALSEKPDIILLDIQLPDMSGMEVLRTLKNDPKTKSIPVVAVTAKAMKGDREKLLDRGFNDYISKPVEKNGLIDVIEKYMNMSKN